MRKLMLFASAAMLLMGQAALAQGKGQGEGGKGRGGGGQSADHQGGGKGGGGKEARGFGGDDRGHQARQAARHGDRGRGRGRDDVARIADDRGKGRGPKVENRGRSNERVARIDRADASDLIVVDRGGDRGRFASALLPGCPPGLAKKNNGCLPPGQAKKIYGDPSSSFFRYAPWYDAARQDDWRYMNGYAYRVDPVSGLVGSFMPLLGGGLFPGNSWPTGYDQYAIDPYYPRYYGYGGNYDYRYVDGALFAVDPRTQRIDSIAALLAGDPWAVGQPMPPGYYAYNVPQPYRSRYYDGPNDWYRYSDGYIYQVDPTTQLVSAIIQLLA